MQRIVFIYLFKKMKGFRKPKQPSKADLLKMIQWLQAQVELYKWIAMRMRNCETIEELTELWEAMKTAKESVIFAKKDKETGKLYDEEGNELLTDQEYEEESQPVEEATEPSQEDKPE